MSEYQYYEFVALDHRLTDEQMDELRALSTRAEITPTRFRNVYNYGNFRGSPERMMEDYFDAHVYVTNWGTMQLMLRLARGVLDEDALRRYARFKYTFTFRTTGTHVVLEWNRPGEEPPDDWVEGEGWMTQLVPLRAELERGDLRALYLGWLAGVQEGYYEEDDYEEDDEEEDDYEEGEREEELAERGPPVPPGLGSLTGAQEALVEFLSLDPDLVDAAARASADEPPPEDEAPRRRAWLETLPREETLHLLERVLEGEDRAVHAELRRRYRAAHRAETGSQAGDAGEGQTIGELFRARRAVREERAQVQRREAEAQRQAEEARRRRYLADVAERFAFHWGRVEGWAGEGKAQAYDKAADRLVDLAEAYAQAGREEEFRRLLADFEERYARKRALIRRLDERRGRLRV